MVIEARCAEHLVLIISTVFVYNYIALLYDERTPIPNVTHHNYLSELKVMMALSVRKQIQVK